LDWFGISNKKYLSWGATSTFHNMHHQFSNSNYSLYFSIWDKLLKSEHKDYLESLRRNSKPRQH
jgi:sterol desaturase/sphingolipid hydroxylase (fatty acid hydroxylase superfamily)